MTQDQEERRGPVGAIMTPPSGLTWLGAASYGLGELAQFETDADTTATALYGYYNAWTLPFDFGTVGEVRAAAMTPMITWEPWDPSQGREQPLYALTAIRDGAYDDYIRQWAHDARSWGHPLFLRFAHEMNGFWYPWGTDAHPDTIDETNPTGTPTNGNLPEHYVAAWQHVHGVFEMENVTNVTWVWAPNVVYDNSTPLADLYPGDDYVDWVGIDGYNFGGTSWKSFFDVFDATLTELMTVTSTKPLMITETSCAEDPLNATAKADWIDAFFAQLALWPDIRGFVWFNIDKSQDDPPGIDWRIQSSTEAIDAFAGGLTGFPAAPAPLRKHHTRDSGVHSS